MTEAELAAAIRRYAYLEGDFVLRSGKRSTYYLDKYRFETRPELLRALGGLIADVVREHAPGAARLAGPELGAVALAAAGSLASGLPFLLVRKKRRITEESLCGLCRQHPEEIPFATLPLETQKWLTLSMGYRLEPRLRARRNLRRRVVVGCRPAPG